MYKELLDDYVEAENRTRGKYCCQECGKGFNLYVEYGRHMRIDHQKQN